MNLIKNILIASSLILVIASCSKEEDEIPLADPGVSAADFDSGYLGIILEGANTMLDSITYTNETKGFSFRIAPSSIIFNQGSDTGYFFKPLRSGNEGDDVNCCIYVNTSTFLDVVFNDSIVTDTNYVMVLDSVGTGKYQFEGTY
ncbi:MAG: hypothetical protein P8Q14_01315 [Vicingaceae bacterium]|nr:hypothetical protein [Vicingaceae bacterium]